MVFYFTPQGFNKIKKKIAELKRKFKKTPLREEKVAESAAVVFMEARIQRDQELALSWLTDNGEGEYLLRSDRPLTGLSNPYFADYEILEREKLGNTQFKFKVRIYEEYTGQGRVGAFDETLIVIKEKEKYLIDSFERSQYYEIWSYYSNPQLGFSMKIPSAVYGLYKCPAKETIQTPVKVFEDNENGIIYISQEYYYKAEWDSELKEYTGPCEKIIYSLALLKSEAAESHSGKPLLGWAVFVKDAKNEGELDEFIKEYYGPGCSAEDKQPLEQQNGVYEVSVSADGTSLGDTTCPIGWMNRIKVLYAPEKNKLMSVILGQECTFLNLHQEPHQCYDEEMINSFRFE